MLLVKKCQFFLYLDLVEIRIEIMLNNFVEKKEKKWHFLTKRRVNPFGKMPFLSR